MRRVCIAIAICSSTLLSCVIYGSYDDRYDPSELDRSDPEHKADIDASGAVALMLHVPRSPKRLRWPRAQTLGEEQDLCPKERFAEELSYPKGCTAVLVAPSVVATAGHCLSSSSREDTWFIFGYDSDVNVRFGELVPLDNAYRGVDVIFHSVDDWALVKLHRDVVERKPVTIREGNLRKYDHVSAAGHPNGIPLKIVLSGTVEDVDVDDKYIITNLDLFEGNSGSPVFDRSQPRRLVGIALRGHSDYVEKGRCQKVRSCRRGECEPQEIAIPAEILLPYLEPYL